jgi:hypothetical protein
VLEQRHRHRARNVARHSEAGDEQQDNGRDQSVLPTAQSAPFPWNWPHAHVSGTRCLIRDFRPFGA